MLTFQFRMLNNLTKGLLNCSGVQKPTKRGVTENP